MPDVIEVVSGQSAESWLEENGFSPTKDAVLAAAAYGAQLERLAADMHKYLVELDSQFKHAVIMRDEMINKLKSDVSSLKVVLSEQLTVTIRTQANAKDDLIDELGSALRAGPDAAPGALESYDAFVVERGEAVIEHPDGSETRVGAPAVH